GAPIRVTVHVVDVSGSTASDSAGMAAYGGGQLISSSLDDTSALLEAVRGAINWKDVTCNEQR
ncbi:MAG: hypothetical protein ACI9WU_003505, partial [Myxococcota bacterium]